MEVAVAEGRGQFGNPEQAEHTPLEAVTRCLMKTVTEDTSVCLCVFT
jgi:hypothetical protein